MYDLSNLNILGYIDAYQPFTLYNQAWTVCILVVVYSTWCINAFCLKSLQHILVGIIYKNYPWNLSTSQFATLRGKL